MLDYRLVELKTGVNKLEIPMTARLAPNFELAVAVMTDAGHGVGVPALAGAARQVAPKGIPPKGGTPTKPIVRFHTSTSPFTVERDLRVKIATKLKSPKGDGTQVRPGDELEVTVTTTDPQGKPVAAELSLAMVEQSLLERFNSPLPPIDDFFRGVQRQSAVRSTFEHPLQL